MLDRSQTVAHTVLDHSECAQIFQRHRIDFCCRGELSIEAAAAERGVDVEALLDELEQAIRGRVGGPAADPRDLSTPRLVAHIVAKHHEYLRTALPFVEALASKVGRVHGDHDPHLIELDMAVGELARTLLPHLEEEEEVLFPTLTAAEPDPSETATMLASMTAEHLEVAALLTRIRTLSSDFRLPDWACNSYRTLFAELAEIEGDIFTHVHLENHVLAPRFPAAGPRASL